MERFLQLRQEAAVQAAEQEAMEPLMVDEMVTVVSLDNSVVVVEEIERGSETSLRTKSSPISAVPEGAAQISFRSNAEEAPLTPSGLGSIFSKGRVSTQVSPH